jgi:hypothetical protein
VIDIAAEGEKALESIGDVTFNLLRRHAGIKGGYDDHGNIDLREEIDGHANDGRDTHNRDYQTKHDDAVGVRESKLGH